MFRKWDTKFVWYGKQPCSGTRTEMEERMQYHSSSSSSARRVSERTNGGGPLPMHPEASCRYSSCGENSVRS
eukprot:scaffold1799_cov191-Amphora_coffeaeformis.AAC.2